MKRSMCVMMMLALAVASGARSAQDGPPSDPAPAGADNPPLPEFLMETADGLIVPRDWWDDPPPLKCDANGIPEGWMVIEEDILVPEDFFDGPDATFDTNFWTNGIVPYRFDANVTQANRNAMIGSMVMWEAVSNVDFIVRTNETNFIHIQDSTANNSSVGMVGGQQIINIVNWGNQFIIAHELAHALGYWHEQSRPDRNAFVQINLANVCQNCCSGGSCNFNFNIQAPAIAYGPYDFDSVMHYGQCAFSTCANCSSAACGANNGQTITVLPPNQAWQNLIGQRDHLSAMDTLTMSFLYPQPNWQFVDAGYTGTPEIGTFLEPWVSFATGYALTPVNGTLWIQPGTYNGVGIYATAKTLRAPLGGVTIGN